MTRVLVIDHHDSYTYNLVHLVAGVAGDLPDVVQHDDPAAGADVYDGYSHIVLSPGPGTVNDVADFGLGRSVIQGCDAPVLGVCLGMQGIVRELGGTVDLVQPAHGDVSVVRHTGEGVFFAVPQAFSVVRYHSQAAVAVPDTLTVSAWCDGPVGRVVMGVQHRIRPLHGVQFHPESVLSQCGEQLIANFLAM